MNEAYTWNPDSVDGTDTSDGWFDPDLDAAFWVDLREEPDCYACGDSGRVGRRRCWGCDPGPVRRRLRLAWWRLRYRLGWFRLKSWLFRRRFVDEGSPF